MLANPYAQYQRAQVETADEGKLLLMLYEGGLRFLGRSRRSLEEGDLEAANSGLVRVQEIVAELMSSLDMESGELAVSLFRLYEYMHYLLVQANVKKQAGPLDQVEKMLTELRDTWKKVVEEGAAVAEQAGETVGEEAQAEDEVEEEAAPCGREKGVFGSYGEGARESDALQKGYKRVNISG